MFETPNQPTPSGLSGTEVTAARERYGWNELPREKPASPASILLRQFRGLLVLMLVAAAAVAFALGEIVDAIAIALVLVLNAVLGFVQEWRAETALDALRSMLSPRAVVVRDGTEQVIAARELVPGDRVIVAAGEAVAADMTLLEGLDLGVDESVMTGESLPVEKRVGGMDAAGRLFAGTTLVTGRAEAVVTAIGAATEFGGIASLTATVDRRPTHLQRRLGQLAVWLGGMSVLLGAAVVGIGLLVGKPAFEMVMTGLSLAVAMMPEGLPAVVTVTLALGASAMARRNALARRLQAVETLGAASVICTDKTGTLTENQMTATRIWTPAQSFDVTGAGYDPAGHIAAEGKRVRATDDPVLARLLETSLICSHASLTRVGDHWRMIGAPTEGALVVLAYKGWTPLPTEDRVVAEIPFSSERKRMSVLAFDGEKFRLYVKGAPEVLLDRCSRLAEGNATRPMTEPDRAVAAKALHQMADRGQRVIALAMRDATGATDLEEDDLTFLGLVGLIDPPRPEVKRAISLARSAGIQVVMITGDSGITACAIAREIGLGELRPVTGDEIDALGQGALADLLKTEILFARTRPEHKLRIVKVLQSQGQIVAMTGDGVNDAPALKQADIGIAMGIRGTDVSKSAADLILLDDNFSTIVGAVAEGRRQYENVKKFVRYLLCSNAGEVLSIVANLLIGGPLIFLATQILWMNLITDGVTAVALGLEKSEPDQMRRDPRQLKEAIVGRGGAALIVLFGVYTGSASLWIFYTFLPLGPDVARTAAFTGMLIFEKASVFAFRSLTQPNWIIGWHSNPLLILAMTASICLQLAAVYWTPLQVLLKTVPLAGEPWAMIVLLALPLVILPEVVKALWLVRSRS